MSRVSLVARTATAVLGMAAALLALVLVAGPAGALGFSGNLSHVDFVLAQGKTSAGTEAYVMVMNEDAAPVRIIMHTETPAGVTIALPEEDFVLEAGGQKRLDVIVQVSREAALGEYTIAVSAEAYKEGEGIKVTGGGKQQTKLTVVKPSLNLALIIGGAGGIAVLAALAVILGRRKRWLRASGKG